jgi:hypothetical protein
VIEPKGEARLLLRFSDGAWGIHDFSRYIEAGTQMTLPLRDPKFLQRPSLRRALWLGRTGSISARSRCTGDRATQKS